MRVLITGISGLLGRHLIQHLPGKRSDTLGLYRRHPLYDPRLLSKRVNLLSPDFQRIISDFGPDVIIHCAGIANVKEVDAKPDIAHRLALDVTEELSKLSSSIGARLIFISTDSVFGFSTSFNKEDDPTNPTTLYARLKLESERIIAAYNPNHVIVRTRFYGDGPPGSHFIPTILFNLSEQKSSECAPFLQNTQIYAGNLAEVLFELATHSFCGVLHIVEDDCLSRLDLALLICDVFGYDPSYIKQMPFEGNPPLGQKGFQIALSNDLARRTLETPIRSTRENIELLRSSQDINFSINPDGMSPRQSKSRTISYGKQKLDKNDLRAVHDVLKSDWLTQGPIVKDFENAIRHKLGGQFCCVTSNGTAALHLVGSALNWTQQDVVFTSPITFMASANAALYSGAIVDFCDVDSTTLNLDPSLLEERIWLQKSRGNRPKAVIAVDFAGHPCDWKELRELADRYRLDLINDHCHALGASYQSDSQYAVKYADAVTLSFHPVKAITSGEGGAIVSNSEQFDGAIRQKRNHGLAPQKPDQSRAEFILDRTGMVELGYNYRLSDIHSALGRSQLNKLEQYVARRREIASLYRDRLSDIPGVVLPTEKTDVRHAYHLFPIQINFSKLNKSKSNLFNFFEQRDILLQVHYHPVHLEPFYKKEFNFVEGDFPIAEEYHKRTVSIPLHPGLSNGTVNQFCDYLQEWLD